MCKANIGSSLSWTVSILIDSELTLGLFYPVSRIVLTFLLILDCMFIVLR